MQLVIEISDGLYEIAQQELIMGGDMPTIANAISNGIVLPKGHGRLGDLDALLEEMVNGIKAGNYEEGFEEYENINNVDDCVEAVRYADTIIEADKEG